MLRNARGGGGVCDPALRSVTGGWGGVLVLVLRNACIYFTRNVILLCRFALL